MSRLALAAILGVALCAGCTFHHSKQALALPNEPPPVPNATFVTEEDSGLSLLGLIDLAEPDHYAVLIERARRRYRCARVHHAQLDFFTDHWLLAAFPIARITMICDPALRAKPGGGAEK